jgi:hypothetical protein
MSESYPPTREEMRDRAREDAQIKVSTLLQTFAMPSVDEDMIEKLLIDTITHSFVAGYASGWDAGLAETADVLDKIERYRR